MNGELYSTPESNIRCYDCNQVIVDKLVCVPGIIVVTEDSETPIQLDMQQALNVIDDYGYKKYYHLSASQILLIRPDVASKALGRIFKKLLFFGFEFKSLCKPCYVTHMQKNPLK